MKYKGLYIATSVFFLLINTRYFWDHSVDLLGALILLIQIIVFLILAIYLLVHFRRSIKEKFRQRQRLFLIGYMSLLLCLSFYYPSGIIDFRETKSETILFAGKRDASNCTTTLRLRSDCTFTIKSICFRITEISGTYFLKRDTIFFRYNRTRVPITDRYAFAVIQKPENEPVLALYHSHADTSENLPWIVKNELIGKKQ